MKQIKSISLIGKVAIMIAAFYTMADMFVVTPVLGEIAMAIPEASGVQVELCYSLSQLTVIIGALLTGGLCKKFSKKTLMLLGGTLVAVFGGLGAILPNINFILMMRAVEGFGAGICITLIPSIITELFDDEKMRNQMMGLQAAVGCVCGALCGAISGQIAVHFGWQKSYFLYFFSVLIILLQLFYLPKTPAESATSNSNTKAPLGGKAWGWAFVSFLFGVMCSAVFLKLAALVVENDLGDASVAGFANSSITIGSFFGSMAMAWLYAKVGPQIDFVCWLLMVIGGGIIIISSEILGIIILLYLGALIFGIANGVMFPWLFSKAAMIAAPGTESQTISITNAGYYVGMFGATFFYQLLAKVFSNNHSVFAISCMTVMCAAIAVIMLILGFLSKQKV